MKNAYRPKAVYVMAFFVLLSCTSGTNSDQPIDDYTGSTAIVDVNVISMVDQSVKPNHTVIIREGKIDKIINKVERPKGATIIEGAGKFLVPGLAEMHAHIPVPGNGDRSMVEETLFLYLSNGITTIRGMLGNPFHIQLRDEIASGEVIGPRIFTSGPSLNGNSSPTPEDAERMIREQKKLGYDFLKMHPGLSRETFDVVDKVADELNMVFSGHVSIDVGIRRALEAKYGSIDHLDGYVEGLVPESINIDPNSGGFFGINFTDISDSELLEGLVTSTKNADVWIVPTQSLLERWAGPKDPEATGSEPEMKYMSTSVRYNWVGAVKRFQKADGFSKEKAERFIELRRTILKKLHDEGVGFLLGSDAPQIFNVPGFSIQHELQAMVRAGLSPYEVLRSGTANPAIFFNKEGEFGTITEGSSADLILVSGNPLDNIENMQNPKGVMVKGEWLSEEYIAKKLLEIAKKYQSDDK